MKHTLKEFWSFGIVLGISVGGYVSLDDMFLLVMIDDVFWTCLMYIHILPNCCFIFQMLSIATVHVQKKGKRKKSKKSKKLKKEKNTTMNKTCIQIENEH